MNERHAILDKRDRLILFSNPIHDIVAKNFDDVKTALEEIDKFREQGFFLVGFISYEASYGYLKFQKEIQKKKDEKLPLVWFGVFTEYRVIEIPESKRNYQIKNLTPEIDEKEYTEKILKIREYLRNGDTYQVNFTFKMFFNFEGDPFDLFLDLRKKQSVKYGYYINLDDISILSLSPELFFRLKNNKITTKPMKGTISRGRYLEEDIIMRRKLKESDKNQAENLMIVDLLRNDLGTISEFGTVKVERLFEIEKYETVFQMTSTISSRLKVKKISEVIEKLFPCGSITGAPKIRTMEIINSLENSPRGIYTGSIGIITKDFSEFNVAIRTPVIKDGKGEIGIGGGITWYSDPKEEYKEAILKSKFVQIPPIDDFKLIETILLKNGKLYLLKLHLKRLKKSAKYFDFKFNAEYIISELKKATRGIEDKRKVRLLLSRNEKVEIEVLPLKEKQNSRYIKIAPERTNSNDIFLFHKTTNRQLYNKYYQRAQEEGLADYIFLNEKGEVTEGCIHNIIILKGNKLLTPKRESGLLRGVMLEYISQKIDIKEHPLIIKDLEKADKIYLCNSVSGIKRVSLLHLLP
jgi:para-aminobenzoate synthetase/4-amino-4-deoxychorismate lyase